MFPFRGTGLANLPWYALLRNRSPSDVPIPAATTVTASATIHTKGAWAQVIASTSNRATALLVQVSNIAVTGSETSLLLDLATGAAGSETPFVENIPVGGARVPGDASNMFLAFLVPISVPAGVRIAARCQALIASDTARVEVALYNLGAAHMVPKALDTLGANTATSRGTVLTGASGSYTEIVASTAKRYRALVMVPSIPTATVSKTATARLTVAVGAAGSEADLGSMVCLFDMLERVSTLPYAWPLPVLADVPAGSRLSVKHNQSTGPGDLAVALIGVP